MINRDGGNLRCRTASAISQGPARGPWLAYAQARGPDMPADYPFERLGWENFERMCVALLRKELGAELEIFGRGRDGGREATYNSPITWSKTGGGLVGTWAGYSVFQVKFRAGAGHDPAQDARWLTSEIRNELGSWRGRAGTLPANIAFVTNARLSSVPETGGIDSINKVITEELKKEYTPASGEPQTSLSRRGLMNFHVLHRDTVIAQLNGHHGVRLAFNLMTEADLFARLSLILPPTTADEMRRVLVNQGEAALKADRYSRFSVDGNQSEVTLAQWVIDLPCVDPAGQRASALALLLHRSSAVKSKSFAPSKPRHVVLTGGPGNGKSTLASFVCQYFRARFLEGEALSPVAATVRGSVIDAGLRMRLNDPHLVRWPMRIDLPHLAEGTFGTETSIHRWIAQLITARADMNVGASDVRRIMRTFPTIFVFDGLDEVTSAEARAHVLQMVNDFVDDIDKDDADAMVVVTTRPANYLESERLPPRDFEQLDLLDLSRAKATAYADHVLALRLGQEPEFRQTVREKFLDLVKQPMAEKLVRTPLQVVILLIIMEGTGLLPTDRYQLFWKYFDTVYHREQEKPTTYRGLFREHRQAIESIHAAVGLALQLQTQSGADVVAELGLPAFQDIVSEQLGKIGHSEATAKEIGNKIVGLATQRLVLLVPTDGDEAGVRFEVRSLQELFAARMLTEGLDSEVEHRLSCLVANFSWRNTWIFMAGRIFSERQHHRYDLVTRVVKEADASQDWPSWAYPVGAVLAANLLDDGMVAALPKWKRELVKVVLTTANLPLPLNMTAIRQGLKSVMGDREMAAHIRNSLTQYQEGAPLSRRYVQWLMRGNELGLGLPGIGVLSPNERFWKFPPGTAETGDEIGPRLHEVLERDGLMDFLPAAHTNAFTNIGRLRMVSHPDFTLVPGRNAKLPVDQSESVAAAVRDDEASEVIRTAIDGLGQGRWAVFYAIGLSLEAVLTREPVTYEDLMEIRG